MSSPNLAIAHIASNQASKEITANSAFDLLDTANTDAIQVSAVAGGIITPTPSTLIAAYSIQFTGALPNATTIVFPNNKKAYRLQHSGTGGFTITCKVTGQPGILLNPGDIKEVYCNGTDIVQGDNTSPQVIALKDFTLQNANIAATTLLATAATGFAGPGHYEIDGYIVVTTVDGTSSTLPSIVIQWTDQDNSTVLSLTLTPTNAGNVLTTYQTGIARLSVKASTNIQFSTTGYASSVAGTMKYALHLRLRFIGS